jgi:hypothetical protein
VGFERGVGGVGSDVGAESGVDVGGSTFCSALEVSAVVSGLASDETEVVEGGNTFCSALDSIVVSGLASDEIGFVAGGSTFCSAEDVEAGSVFCSADEKGIGVVATVFGVSVVVGSGVGKVGLADGAGGLATVVGAVTAATRG